MKGLLVVFKSIIKELPPERLKTLGPLAEATQRRLDAAEKKRDESKGNVARELQQAFQGLEHLSENEEDIARTIATNLAAAIAPAPQEEVATTEAKDKKPQPKQGV